MQDVKKIVKAGYAEAAGKSCCACSKQKDEDIAKMIGYSDEEINAVPDANLGLGCGNPVALGNIKPGDTVLDLVRVQGLIVFCPRSWWVMVVR